MEIGRTAANHSPALRVLETPPLIGSRPGVHALACERGKTRSCTGYLCFDWPTPPAQRDDL